MVSLVFSHGQGANVEHSGVGCLHVPNTSWTFIERVECENHIWDGSGGVLS